MYRKNLRLFEKLNPRGAMLLAFCNSSTLRFEKTEKGEVNFFDTSTEKYVHSQKGALDEAKRAFKKPRGSISIVYGIGCGYSFEARKEWLDQDEKRLFFVIEDDIRYIDKFLETEIGSRFMAHPRAHLLYYEKDAFDEKDVVDEVAWACRLEDFTMQPSPYYKKVKKEAYEALERRFSYHIYDVQSSIDEYVKFGAPYFCSFWPNLLFYPSSYCAGKLKNKFKGIPAVICGAGPSLEKELPHFFDLRDKALFFAGGSAIPALTRAGFQPHFTTSIDPNETQMERFRLAESFEVPHFYRPRAHHESLKMITGPKLLLKGGDGYYISEYFEKKLRVKGPVLGGGHSVANFMIDIAHFLGCSPLILVGFDFAYTDGKAYAKGATEGAGQVDDEKITVKDKQGNPVETHYKWIHEADWIGEFQKKRKRQKIINATSGGISIPHVKELSFEKVKETFLQEKRDLDGLVHKEIFDIGTIRVTSEKLFILTQKMLHSLLEAINLLDQIIHAIEKNLPDIVALETQLYDEEAYGYLLDIFARMRVKQDFYTRRFFFPLDATKKECEKYDKKERSEFFSFLREAALLNALLIAKTVFHWEETKEQSGL